jgi:hypothetical protein
MAIKAKTDIHQHIIDNHPQLIHTIVDAAVEHREIVEAARLAKEAEEARLAKEAEDARLAKEAEDARLAKEAAEKAEAERVAKEAAGKAEAERVAKEAAEKAEAERVAKEAAEKAEAERVAKEAAEKEEAERVAKEAAEKAEAERVAKEAAEKAEAERVAKEAAEAKAKTLTSPELKKFAKALFDAKHHQEIKADGAKLLSITDKEEMIKAVTAFQVMSKKVSGLGGDGETEICHDRNSELSNYCYFPGEKNTKSGKYVDLVNKWVVKFTENAVNKPDAQMKQDVAIAQQIAALKAGCETATLNTCMQEIVNYYCTSNDGTLAHDTLCHSGFSVDGLIA